MALVAALTGHLLVLFAGRAEADLVGVCLLAQLPLLAAVTMGRCSSGRTLRTPLGSLAELGLRAEHAEEALSREHERLHELRSTLAGISASYRVLHDPRTQLTPQHRRRLQAMHDAELDRLERLLAGRTQSAGSVDLDAVLARLADASGLLGSVVAWTPSGRAVRGRADDVTEVLHVLLENAARHGAGREVEVSVLDHGHEIDVRVTDHGPGVAPEVLPRLFQRRARGLHSPGDGLGLSIARRLAVGMGGRLRLEPPRAGEPGATFVLTLPADTGTPPCLAASG